VGSLKHQPSQRLLQADQSRINSLRSGSYLGLIMSQLPTHSPTQADENANISRAAWCADSDACAEMCADPPSPGVIL